MKKRLHNLSGKIDKILLEAIDHFVKSANSLHIPFFIMGASARDLILEKAFDLPTYRATLDVDLGIRIKNWDELSELKMELIRQGQFKESARIHRLVFKNQLSLDLIPFGPVSESEDIIRWPPGGDFTMNTMGMEEAFNSTETAILQFEPQIEVKIVSLACLSALKLFSWKEKYPERMNDAVDLAIILRSYSDAGNFERIFEELPEIVDSSDYDYFAAGARLLGRDIARIFKKVSIENIVKILAGEIGDNERYLLIEDMIRSRILPSIGFTEMLRLLKEMLKGIKDKVYI